MPHVAKYIGKIILRSLPRERRDPLSGSAIVSPRGDPDFVAPKQKNSFVQLVQ